MANPYISLLRTAWIYARKERKRYVLVYAMFVVSAIINALYPVLLGWFINKIQQDTQQVLHYAFLYAGSYFVLKLLEWAFHGPARVMERELAFNLSRNFLQERYHQVLHLPVKWHQDHHSGATINRIRKAYEALKTFFDHGFMYLRAVGKLIFSVAAIVYFSPLFGTIGVVLGIITIWVIFKFDKPFIRTLDEVNEKEHVVSSTLFDSLSNIMTVITLRLEKSMETGLLGKVHQIVPPFKKNIRINEWKWFVADVLITVIYCVVAVGYIIQYWQPGQVFYIAGLVTLLGYVNQFTSVFYDFAWQYTDITQYNTYVQTAANIDEAFKKQHRPDAPTDLPDSWQMISIKDLNFSHREEYAEHAPQSLHGLNIQIPRGKRIALIGESGSGKSTLLSLLRGLYDPQPGMELSVDGKIYDMDTLNETVTLFPQEPEIFENTIAYNVTLGLPFSEADIEEVCEGAHFTDVIRQLPLGLESDIREKGVNLSGGQKQRLALARGILAARESEVVLLDEPTSSVDPKTEVMIYTKLFKAFADKAVISSIHRLHLLTHFDYVYILQQGKIVGEGTFEQLKEHSPIFQELWKHQKDTMGKHYQ
ncbi:ABC transporter ATP-binding protein [Chitinophaga pinensis]|uniref:ABC transporter related n=1 Tax=Chitinophaga pinensis (strain ATCC 43595 / DSM 2588 / LMG 13176 / NBRC 15968 / NCIMB 11800 / UQM 2034) TaxID=485918 RepID=A0A979GQM4_CHIPD|nr:ABC transporter ATP-binding protein [Chitinophaga pinensis]ACU61657.1 ABC transporter related [Chitinophaga pinensis DSM 2588]